jgi:hypothetical protein
LGGKTKFSPRTVRDRPHRHGDQNPASMSRPSGHSFQNNNNNNHNNIDDDDNKNKRACLPCTDSSSAPRGVRGTGAITAGTRPATVHAKLRRPVVGHCGASPQRNQEQTSRRDAELRPEYSRSHDRIEIARPRDAAVALWHVTARGAGASGTRDVVLPRRRLNEASPAGPGRATMHPLRSPPGGYPTCTKCRFCP